MSRRFAFLLALTCAGSLSCGSRDTGLFAPRAVPILDIRMELTAFSAGNRKPALIIAVVRNAGDISVNHINMCPVPVIRFYDEQNIEILQRDPTQPVPCPLMLPAPLRGGESVELVDIFVGTHFSASGEQFEAPPGTYRAVATFEYRTLPSSGGTEERGVVTREATFAWD
jgi:hypothetical protein